MLDQLDLGQKLVKSEYKEQMDRMGIKLGELHRKIHELGIPDIVVFEGWDAAGRGTLINELQRRGGGIGAGAIVSAGGLGAAVVLNVFPPAA